MKSSSDLFQPLRQLERIYILRMRLNSNMLTSQRYYGASSMSSKRVGVSIRIREKASMAWNVHCSGHVII